MIRPPSPGQLAVGLALLAAAHVAHAQRPGGGRGVDGVFVLEQPVAALGDRVGWAIVGPEDIVPAGAKAELVLLGPDGDVVRRGFAEAGRAGALVGYTEVPFGAAPGVYRLVVEGLSADARAPSVLAEAYLPVYDALDAARHAGALSGDVADYLGATAAATLPTVPAGEGGVTLTPPPSPRSAYRIAGDTAALAFAQVLDAELFPTALPTHFAAELPGGGLDTALWLVGTWTDGDGGGVASNLLAVLRRGGRGVEFAKSDAGGVALARLSPFRGEDVLQVFEAGLPERRFVRARPARSARPRPALPNWPALDRFLEASAARTTIYAAYGRTAARVPAPLPAPRRQPREADVALAVADFTPFATLGEFAYEVFGTATRWRPTRRGPYVRVFNRRTKEYFTREPLVVFDGYVTEDVTALSALDPGLVDTMRVYGAPDRLRELYPGVGQWGVIELTLNPTADVAPAAWGVAERTVEMRGLEPELRVPEEASVEPALTFVPVFGPFVGAGLRHGDDKSTFLARLLKGLPTARWTLLEERFRVE